MYNMLKKMEDTKASKHEIVLQAEHTLCIIIKTNALPAGAKATADKKQWYKSKGTIKQIHR